MFGQSKAVLITLITSLVLTGVSFTAGAQSLTHPVQNNKEVSVKYIGTENDMMVYSVQFSNPSGIKYHFCISDNTGAVLFRDVFHVTQFNKIFKIPKEHTRLDFVVVDAADKTRRKISLNDGLSFAMAK
jgi:hypothetical protein